MVVQCKRYIDKLVGSKELQSFIMMMTVEHGVDRGVYVTTSGYTKPLFDLRRRHGVELIDCERPNLDVAVHLDRNHFGDIAIVLAVRGGSPNLDLVLQGD